MSSRRARVIAAWSICIAAAALVVARARYITDLSAFLPAKPTPMQRLLVDQLREGPGSRLILVALEQGDAKTRAEISLALAHRLRLDREFSSVNNGEQTAAERDREFLFRNRYLLSPAVNRAHFTVDGLKGAIGDTIGELASAEGLLLKPLVPHDPTGEMLRIIEQLTRSAGPRTRDSVWVSADGERTLLVAETAAAGSDTDAQERALDAIRTAFAAAALDIRAPAARSVQLNMSGPGVFAVAARAKIKGAAMRLSLISGSLVIVLLLAVYRSPPALLLGLLPVATGALIGVACVALGFGAVHGITLGFGITLIGESVDYSVYFFIQSLPGLADSGQRAWRQRLWPTIRLGMLTSVCGFASLLPAGFPGLAQLGAYSISGLIAAAAVTRFVLPELLPAGLVIRDVAPLGSTVGHLLNPVRRLSATALWGTAAATAAAASLVLYSHRDSLWNRELSGLSPVPVAQQRYDAQLRADLGAANVLDLVVVSGPDLESVLSGAEHTAPKLDSLIDANLIGGFDSPANYLPSLATQEARRASLPDAATLRENLRLATSGLALHAEQLAPFIDDVEAARAGGLILPQDLGDTSLAAGYRALVLHGSDGWSALLPLHAANPATPDVDLARVSGALAVAESPDVGASRVQLLDLKRESDALYASYLQEGIRLSLAGLATILALLLLALRSPVRVARVIAPLILAVLCVSGGLAACGVQLTILHLVGMLLIVAVGSNYALFFDAQGRFDGNEPAPLTLASLVIANLSTVIGFGLLSFSQVPVLVALGTTVAPGTFLALLFAALLTSRGESAPPARRGVDA
jgi:predicted exporter